MMKTSIDALVRHSLISLVAVASFATAAPAFAQEAAKKYVCPPCAGGCDEGKHDGPGNCDGCGMTLILAGGSSAKVETQEVEGDYICPPCAGNCHDVGYDAPGKCKGCGMTLIAKSSIKGGKLMRNVAVLIYNGVELLDFAGPGEVFAAAGNRFNVYLVASSREPIVSQGFVTITPEFTLDDCPKPDVIVLPGGRARTAMNDAKTMSWVAAAVPDSEVTMSVCSGAFILAKAGLLDGLEATTHWGAIAGLREAAKKTKVHENRRFVDNGKIVTAAGVSAGIDAALHVVSRLLGEETARSTARYMEYRWQPESPERDRE